VAICLPAVTGFQKYTEFTLQHHRGSQADRCTSTVQMVVGWASPWHLHLGFGNSGLHLLICSLGVLLSITLLSIVQSTAYSSSI